MTAHGLITLALFCVVVTLAALPLGGYLARVYAGDRPVLLEKALGPLERLLYRAAGVRKDEEMSWRQYALAVLLFNLAGVLVVYGILRLQAALPLNPAELGAVTPEVSFNTATSFTTNTNWQSYGGESTLSYLSQMVALTVQNFVSAATGMAVLVALARCFSRASSTGLGNFWVDLTRGTLYVLLPLSLLLAIFLVSQGVVQSFEPYPVAKLVEATLDADGNVVRDQTLAVGPAASQIAIKQLGTNGGGFFNVNSAHPFENPTPLSGFVELVCILVIPAAFPFLFGALVKDKRQGWALFAAMAVVLVPLMIACLGAEQSGNPMFHHLGVDTSASSLQPGGNMSGKEARFGIADSAAWATATTAASNGSVNSMHDSFTPLGGLVPMWLIQLGEIIFGGVGSGLYGMILYAVVAVFIAGLMVGRTPEYLGKKIEAFEMKMAMLGILLPAASVLVFTAITAVGPEEGVRSLANPGAHGFSEILYAYSSASNNNGSAFGGLTASGPWYATTLGIAMLIGRYWVIVPVLAIAGSLVKKKTIPGSPGTLPTHTPLFVGLLTGTVVLVGALTFIPALALGPIVEHLQMWGH
ncbi:MAG: potassium-transporting ATPase subunit KdpA [Polyangiaceae bacterium]|nr:potassium-transporting ATPase subunit KdpA [Polyangiaceae bacterium]